MNRTALVTGGSRGIGLGIATALANEGWDLVINGVRPEQDLGETLDQLRQSGTRVSYAQGDVGSAEDRRRVVDQCHADGRRLNLLINNAGVAPSQRLDLLETTEESYDRVMNINLKGPFFLSQAVAQRMVAARTADPGFPATIVNVGSISATVASVSRGEYCLSKAGIGMMTRLFAARLGKEDIPVYEIRPGVTRTDMTSAVTEKYDRLIADGLCVQPRWGQPDDIGKAVASLARGDFPYSTGQVIMVDGGLTIARL